MSRYEPARIIAAEMMARLSEEHADDAWLHWCRVATGKGVRCDVVDFDGIPVLLDNAGRKSMTTIRRRRR